MDKQVEIIDFPKIKDSRGNLTFIEESNHIPFSINRAFWIYDIPGGEKRGGHAYKKQEELIIALSGSFDVIVETSEGKKESYSLNRSYYGLYIPPHVWRHIENFSTNSLSLHLSSHLFDEDDYIYNFEKFKQVAQ